MKKLLFIAVLFSAIAPKILSISTGFFQLSVFRACILITPIVMVLISLKHNSRIRITSKENSYSVFFMLIWLVYAFISVIWVQDLTDWLRGIYFIGIGVICVFLFQAIFKEHKDIINCFYLLGIIVFVHNIIGWYEIFSGNYYFSSLETAARYARFRIPVSVFGNVNDFSIYMLFGTFISYACFKSSSRMHIRVFFISTMFSSIIITFVSGSRGVIIGLSMALIWFIFSISKSRAKILLGVGSILLIFILSLLTESEPTVEQTIKLEEETGRVNLLKNGLYFLGKTFGFGTGAGNIEYWMLNKSIYPTGILLNIHNWWAEILVGYGILIFLMYIFFYLSLFKSMYISYKYQQSTISLVIMCCMVGFIVGSISSSSNIDSEWQWVFWAIAITYQGLLSNRVKDD